ncbi:hypothetical protein [Motilibacter aurantiacus]|uniref:hypothetical protein n=1 Tax=Motilibacter aurantiacus TaxID=2714955 RepID=UPI00140CFC1F|nr:hypothetical protein [Motilibacter aurantiacus]NHC46744.1 hypothetical protein [Motilibacter aurantiacus]
MAAAADGASRTAAERAAETWAAVQTDSSLQGPEVARAAENIAAKAEARMRDAAPQVMGRYDQLRGEGARPVPAMRAAGKDTGQDGRAANLRADAAAAARSAGTHTTHAVRDSAVPDDPATPRVDEHADARRAAAPERIAARADAERAAAIGSQTASAAAQGSTATAPPADRRAADTAATSFPHAVNSVPASAARPAAPTAGAPAAAATQQPKPAVTARVTR